MCSIIQELWSLFIYFLSQSLQMAHGSCMGGTVHMHGRCGRSRHHPCPQKGGIPFVFIFCASHPPLYALCLSRAVRSGRNNPEVKQKAWVPDLCSAYVRLVDNLPCPGCCSEGSPPECTGTEGWFPKGRSMAMSDHHRVSVGGLCGSSREGMGSARSQRSFQVISMKDLLPWGCGWGVEAAKISDDSGKVLEIETPSSSPIGARTVLHPL